MADKRARLEIVPAADFNQVQAMLMTAITSQHDPHLNIVSIINSCGWPLSVRIICDDLDGGEIRLELGLMCHFSFSTMYPGETLVFCQAWGEGRTLSFDVWGGTSPRGLNVWSLLPDVDNGLALNGTIKKGWSVIDSKDNQDGSSNVSEDDDDEDEQYYSPHFTTQNEAQQFDFPSPNDARVPNSRTDQELII